MNGGLCFAGNVGAGPDTWYFGGQYASSMGLDDYRSLLGKICRTKTDWLGEEHKA
jgi:hypothetical protein